VIVADVVDADIPSAVRQELRRLAFQNGVGYPVLCRVYALGASTTRVVGPTGAFPYGKLDPDDEGELSVAIAADRSQGVVRFEFGKPVAFLALPAAHARTLAAVLLEKARELERGAH
jgi:hypothetical protein